MIVYHIPVLSTNYVYLMVEGERCIVIDPGEFSPVDEFIEKKGLMVEAVLLTHKHWDHVGGVEKIVDKYKVPVYGGKNEVFSIKVKPLKSHIKLMGLDIEVLELPGHTLGAVGFYVNDVLFTGDVLFAAGCGYVFEGTSNDMVRSLDLIRELPDNTKIYPGHEYLMRNLSFAIYMEPDNAAILSRIRDGVKMPSTLGLEKETNPFLRLDDITIIERVNSLMNKSIGDRVDRFTCLRKLKTEFDERE